MRKSMIPLATGNAAFSPDRSTCEVEHLTFNLPGVSILEVAIHPARHNKQATATLESIEVANSFNVGAVNVSRAVVE
jgi:hypothetical protein